MRYLVPSWTTRSLPWVKVETLAESFRTESIAWQQAGLLDPGEAEAVALARQLEADWLLTDGAAARLVAQTHGLEVHGSLGIVLWAAAVGHFDRSEAESVPDRLVRSSLWVSARVLTEAGIALERLFS